MRQSELTRNTKETQIQGWLDLDNPGLIEIDTGVGFLNHMLTLMAFHGRFSLKLTCQGDLDVDDHHSVEDCGIVLGSMVKAALGSREGISRYGNFTVPMDEALANVVLDISGRPFLVYNCELTRERIGTFSTEMLEEFLRAFAVASGITLHVNVLYGKNDHHKAEAVFKALGRALAQAWRIDGTGVSSTKGMLE